MFWIYEEEEEERVRSWAQDRSVTGPSMLGRSVGPGMGTRSLTHSIVPLGTEPEPVARKSVVVVGWAWEADVTGETIEG